MIRSVLSDSGRWVMNWLMRVSRVIMIAALFAASPATMAAPAGGGTILGMTTAEAVAAGLAVALLGLAVGSAVSDDKSSPPVSLPQPPPPPPTTTTTTTTGT